MRTCPACQVSEQRAALASVPAKLDLLPREPEQVCNLLLTLYGLGAIIGRTEVILMAQNRTRSERIELRATKEEKQALEKAAKAAGMTVTAFILFMLGEVAGEAIGTAIKKGGKK